MRRFSLASGMTVARKAHLSAWPGVSWVLTLDNKSFDEGVTLGSWRTCWESLTDADRSKRFNDARNKLIEAAERWERFATSEWGILVEDEREIGRNFGPQYHIRNHRYGN